MEYVLLAVGAAAGIYLLRRHWQWRNDEQPLQQRIFPERQAQAGRVEESEAAPVDFQRYRVSLQISGGKCQICKIIQAPWNLKRFIQDQVIPRLNLQRSDLNTDQFAAVILSDKNLNHINELQLLSKNIYIFSLNSVKQYCSIATDTPAQMPITVNW